MGAYFSWVKGISADVDDMYEKKEFNAKGPQFLFFMTAMYLGIRGFMDLGAYYAASPLIQAAGIDTRNGAQITSTMRLPWSLKCIWAMTSDILPIFYYKKRWYMLFFTIVGSIALYFLATLSYEVLAGPNGGGYLVLMLLLLVNVMGSLDDCLTQGKYTQVIKARGSSILIFRSSLMTTAGMLTALYAGYLNDVGPQWLFFTALPWAVIACIPIGLNMMADERQETPCTPDTELLKSQKGAFALAIAMGITVGVNISFGLVAALKPLLIWRMIVTNAFMIGVFVLSFVTIDRRIAFINVYLYLCRICTFGMGYPLQQFYTTDPSQHCPNTDMNLPNFSFLIYNTFGGLASNIAQFLGLFLFENYIVHWNAQRAFWVTTAFQVVAGLFDIMNVTRFNQTLLGWTGLSNTIEIPSGDIYRPVRMDDLATFLFGSAFLEPLIDTMDSLPATLLLSKLCPKGIETTMFALLAGFSNIGLSLSGQIGGYYTSNIAGFAFRRGNSPAESVCDMGGSDPTNPKSFHGLAQALVLGNVVLPFLTIPLTWIFIPNQPLDSDFLDEGDEAGVELQAEAGFDPPPAPLGRGGSKTASKSGILTSNAEFDGQLLKNASWDVSGARRSGIL